MLDLSEHKVTAVKARHFKCFGDEAMGFETFKPFNVIIGRNNAGKSSMLDMLEYFVKPETTKLLMPRRGSQAEFLVAQEYDRNDLNDCFRRRHNAIRVSHSNGAFTCDVPSVSGWCIQSMPDLSVTCVLKSRGFEFLDYGKNYNETGNSKTAAILEAIKGDFAGYCKNPFNGFRIARLHSERDVRPEPAAKKIEIKSNGTGLTNAIQAITHRDPWERDLVEQNLLAELNKIFYPDALFIRILTEQREGGDWEIFLEEEKKGRVRLSQMGSGMKTVLLVLSLLDLLPAIDQSFADRSRTIFAFEELENNLHPAVQRRLFHYLHKRAVQDNSTFVVTTHSNVVIDMFTDDQDSQILHVSSDGESSTVDRVDTWDKNCSVLDDLDVRASDILQTNVVVWVEGPSDRIYFRRWIDLWADENLIEGVHYVCLPYGGSVNAHLSLDDPEIVENLMAGLRINRNAVLLADSDRRTKEAGLKVHTERLKKEVESNRGCCWITDGKEVENYVPAAALKLHLENEKLTGPSKYTDVLTYVKEKTDNKNPPKKTALAHAIAPLLTKRMLKETLDMSGMLDEVVSYIKNWNRMDS